MIILSLETSCDETACAILEEKNGAFSVLANIVSSQIDLHAKWGGVVPNLAAREHLKNIMPVIDEAFHVGNKNLCSLRGPKDIDLIAVTNGPGLIPALLIGVETAKTLSFLWKKPLIGIHHIEGHIYANFIGEVKSHLSADEAGKSKVKQTENLSNINFPILCLIVSGGHTQLVLMKKHLSYEIIGETQDDAVGEAFDKVARILGLGYPGGPAVAKEAKKIKKYNLENSLPRPMIASKDFNFSFSGLKTAVLYLVKKNEKLLKDKSFISAVACEFQQAVCDVLISKTIRAAKKYNPKTIMLAGGVSANIELRQQLGEAIEKEIPDTKYQIPEIIYSIDNAAMIAMAAFFRYKLKKNKDLQENWKKLEAKANLKLT